jgi:hypothetical protein
MPKIVQTFWSGNESAHTYLANTGGWLSAEYHWMAWALSCLQIRQFYPTLELFTDSLGEHFFKEILKLPYTNIIPALDTLNQYDKRLWALAKIYTYSLQTEPFIHLDGDVFIWKKFEHNIENAQLIAQNFEVDFPFYQAPLRAVQQFFDNVPVCMLTELEHNTPHIYSCNTGVIGGNEMAIFQHYKALAFQIIDDNEAQLSKVDMQYFNICFEQFLYYALAKSENIPISYLVEKEFDPTYPHYANFHEVPHSTWYIHAMAAYKKMPTICHHLARRLRKDYQEYYYRIIEICISNGIELDWKCYPLSQLDNKWKDIYEKDKKAYETVEYLFSQPVNLLLETCLQFSSDYCHIEEQENPVYSQILHYPNITTVAYTTEKLDSLNIILLDTFQEPISIFQAIEICKPYFEESDITKNPLMFQELILSRIRDWLFHGVLVTSPLSLLRI